MSTLEEAKHLAQLVRVPLKLAKIVTEIAHEEQMALRHVRGPCRRKEMVAVRRKIAKRASASGFGQIYIGRALNRDSTTVQNLLKPLSLRPLSSLSTTRYADSPQAYTAQ